MPKRLEGELGIGLSHLGLGQLAIVFFPQRLQKSLLSSGFSTNL